MDEQWRQLDGQLWQYQGTLYRAFVVQQDGQPDWICAVIDGNGQWLRHERFPSVSLACAWCVEQIALLERQAAD